MVNTGWMTFVRIFGLQNAQLGKQYILFLIVYLCLLEIRFIILITFDYMYML